MALVMSDLDAHPRGRHAGPERWHRAGSGAALRNFVFGSADGLVTVLAFVAGVSASLRDRRLVLLAGIAEMFAGAISMGLGAYLGTRAEQHLYERERARETREVKEVPHLEREEVREIYRRKGFEGPDLEAVVDRLTDNAERWVDIMMAEELGLAPVEGSPLIAGVTVGGSYIVAAAVPLISYLFLPVGTALLLSLGLTGLALAGVGVAKANFTQRSLARGAVETLLMGLAGTAVCYGIGQIGGYLLAP
jgi:VIT1/CCC1 family predicted Fe2+/Mn2+ transporter